MPVFLQEKEQAKALSIKRAQQLPDSSSFKLY